MIQYENDYGFIEYDEDNKTVVVEFPDVDKKKVVEEYLTTKHLIRNAQDGLRNFAEQPVEPLKSLENLKLALTRMWNFTGILVQWSLPTGK